MAKLISLKKEDHSPELAMEIDAFLKSIEKQNPTIFVDYQESIKSILSSEEREKVLDELRNFVKDKKINFLTPLHKDSKPNNETFTISGYVKENLRVRLIKKREAKDNPEFKFDFPKDIDGILKGGFKPGELNLIGGAWYPRYGSQISLSLMGEILKKHNEADIVQDGDGCFHIRKPMEDS